MSSSPIRDTNESLSHPRGDSGSHSRSQTQRLAGDGSSSPLFMPSSDAGGSDRRPFFNASTHGGSSPLHYTSSTHPSSDRGFQSGGARQPTSGRIYSDLPTSERDHTPRRRFRGDLQDSTSSPRRSRRMVETTRTTVNGSQNSSLPNLSSLSSMAPLDEGPVRVIWGTNVSINDVADKFRDFLLNFKYRYRKELDGTNIELDQDISEEMDEVFYLNELKAMHSLGLTNLNLDAKNLRAYVPTRSLYFQLINYPQEVIPIMDQSLKETVLTIMTEENATDDEVSEIEKKIYTVRPYNIDLVQKGIRELNPNDIDKLVSVKGLVLRSTPIIPDMKVAFFKCNACDHTVAVEIDRGIIAEPKKCPREACRQPNSMVLIHNRSSFADKQIIKLQETPDLVPDGQTPHSINLCVYDELVDTCRAGDRIEVCGIFRSIPVRINSKQRALKSLYKTYLDIVHVKKIDKRRMGADPSTLEQELSEKHHEVEDIRRLSAQDIEKIKETSQRDDLYELLARSLAPSVYEMDDVKKGILLQLFGGANKTFKKGGRYRGDINILLCGDPSTSKSQLLQYVHKIAPRGIYTSGKGSSAVGLTAYVTRDVDTKQLVLESGALVLSDGGICCIDEFDKMSDSTRSVLHEVMEQQTISIAKAGIITTLNARTSILASANPINSRYDPNLPVTANIDLPPPLLSRFDLVYLILDRVDEVVDRQLARHLTEMYLVDAPDKVNENYVLPVEFVTMYIQYAKENIQPVMTERGKQELVRAYVEMRKLGDDARASDKRITATTRQLESMIRLSEAHAKMRLSSTVELIDVKEAVRLIKSAIKEYATDPVTGRIDMDMVQTGTTVAQRRLQEDLSNEIMAILELDNGSIRLTDLVVRLNERSSIRVESQHVHDAIKRMTQEGRVIRTGDAHRSTISKVNTV
ncbi:DNA replication licensing factor, mcm4 component [Scheffersomyces spartinae]|uniref:DNA replication licensing factor MCM4 n=1 Tax=Scheffersomyces spartinae TaxID=45513 RepID=A0A9P8AIT9_9ASCO|nr:DNA replication licensing factor, mcm4 component [Scheffersomyces spartinae]KAG7194743.1 DNA replication licensing factor, mcm4 component [Scheffersomyces spartinae]